MRKILPFATLAAVATMMMAGCSGATNESSSGVPTVEEGALGVQTVSYYKISPHFWAQCGSAITNDCPGGYYDLDPANIGYCVNLYVGFQPVVIPTQVIAKYIDLSATGGQPGQDEVDNSFPCSFGASAPTNKYTQCSVGGGTSGGKQILTGWCKPTLVSGKSGLGLYGGGPSGTNGYSGWNGTNGWNGFNPWTGTSGWGSHSAFYGSAGWYGQSGWTGTSGWNGTAGWYGSGGWNGTNGWNGNGAWNGSNPW